MRRFLSVLLSVLLVFSLLPLAASAADFSGTLTAPSAVLIEASTGTVLYEKNADERRAPASVTKLMTILLIFEALDGGRLTLDETVTVSANAASMGGSQVFLAQGERMTAEALIKSIVIASANDAAVAMAEHLEGSEESFVAAMNRRAAELGCVNTHFENVTGLDDTTVDHRTSARDIAVMAREVLLNHPKVLEYSGIWQDSIRDGAFTLTNTNRLIRFYNGAIGLKTGSTGKAGFCLCATAKRGETHLIAVVMGCATRDIRNAEAKQLLDYGFANYEIYSAPGDSVGTIRVRGGVNPGVTASYSSVSILLPKGQAASVKRTLEVPELLDAPVEKGSTVGALVYRVGETELARVPISADETVSKIRYGEILWRVLQNILSTAG